MPAFHHRPATLRDVVDQTVNRALDMLGIELDADLFPRWQGPCPPARDAVPPVWDAAQHQTSKETLHGKVVP